jgi:AcrR family transcriptional regulator
VFHIVANIQYRNLYQIDVYTFGKVTKNLKKKVKTEKASKRAAKVTEKRIYESPARQRQADETRKRIAAAARGLLEETGYAGMTIPAVAKAAGVAVPTVYAIFGSKKGIVAELLDVARFGEAYQALITEARKVTDPMVLLEFPPRFARKIYEAEIPMENLLRGAGMVAPELAAVEDERNCQRYDSQLMVIDALGKAQLLRDGLSYDAARSVLWAMTSRELFRMLVRERGWTGDQYEAWLRAALRRELVGQ